MNDIKKEFNTKFGEPMLDYSGHRTTWWVKDTVKTDDVMEWIEQKLKEAKIEKWVGVKDKLPEEKQSIIFYINEAEFSFDERIATGIYLNGQFYDDDFNDWGLQTTHWMPLPEPPLSEFKGEK